MNLNEFAALKVGDEIRNDMTHSDGVITAADNRGVRVAWSGLTVVTYHYGVDGTAWFHWSVKPKAVSADDLERHEGDLEDRERGA